MSGGGGGSDMAQASRINSELARNYAAVGLPAAKFSLNYAGNAMNAGLPAYANNAYADAATTALESSVAGANTARGQLMRNLGVSGGGLPAMGQVATGAGRDLAEEIGSIGVSRAMAGIAQRDKMRSILMGGGASATDLGANFGRLNVQALGDLGVDPGAYPYVMGGIAALSPLLLKSNYFGLGGSGRPVLGAPPMNASTSTALPLLGLQ